MAQPGETRRDTLKIIGATGVAAAFPLHAQDHAHEAAQALSPAAPYKPVFLSAAEFALVSRIADLIIPPTDTPGAVAAGVPGYIDSSLAKNSEGQSAFRAGLALVDSTARSKHGKRFVQMSEANQIELLTPWSDACDKRDFSSEGAKFFRTVKGLTTDGYYTSYQGLVQELGYVGNVALAAFPGCTDDH